LTLIKTGVSFLNLKMVMIPCYMLQKKPLARDFKIFRMNRLGIPQDRIAKKMGINQVSIHNHLLKMATLPNLINADLRVPFRLSRGFTVAQVAQKHGWTDPMVWSLALEGKNDNDRFKELGWGLRT
jgi:hypothetical protein